MSSEPTKPGERSPLLEGGHGQRLRLCRNDARSSDGPDRRAAVSGQPVLRNHGGWLAALEVGVLMVCCVMAMATDQRQTREANELGARHTARFRRLLRCGLRSAVGTIRWCCKRQCSSQSRMQSALLLREVGPSRHSRSGRCALRLLPPGIAAVGVFVNHSRRQILDAVHAAGLTTSKLHGDGMSA